MQVFISAASNAFDNVRALELALRHHCHTKDWGFHSISNTARPFDIPAATAGDFMFRAFLDVPVITRHAIRQHHASLAAIARDKVAEAFDAVGIVYFVWHWPAHFIHACKTCQAQQQTLKIKHAIYPNINATSNCALAVGESNNRVNCIILASAGLSSKAMPQRDISNQHRHEMSTKEIEPSNYHDAANIISFAAHQKAGNHISQPRNHWNHAAGELAQAIEINEQKTNRANQYLSRQNLLQVDLDQQFEPLFCLSCHLRTCKKHHHCLSLPIKQDRDKFSENTIPGTENATVNAPHQATTSNINSRHTIHDHTRYPTGAIRASTKVDKNNAPRVQLGDAKHSLLRIPNNGRQTTETRDTNIYPLPFARREAAGRDDPGSAAALNKGFEDFFSQEIQVGKTNSLLLPVSRSLISEKTDKQSAGWPGEHWSGYLSLKGYFENLQRMKTRSKLSSATGRKKKKPSI